MNTLLQLALVVSILSFGWYGARTFLSTKMKQEFRRYGIARLRALTGTLQILGALGLASGHFFWPLQVLSAAGLGIMMLIAVRVRIKIKDPWRFRLPAVFFFALNLLIVVLILKRHA